MDDFPGLMADFGIRQQGKAAPMAPPKSASIGSRSANPLSFEDIFNSSTNTKSSSASSMPVYDKPVYDDDIFEGVPGIRSTSSNNKVEYEDVFGSNLSKGGGHVEGSGGFDDFLGGLGSSSSRVESKKSDDFGSFDELLPGFGGSSPPNRREPLESSQQKSSKSSKATPNDPFAAFEMASAPTYSSSGMASSDPLENHSSSINSDPFENLGKPTNLKNTNADTSPASSGMFDDIDAFDGFSSKSVPSYTSEKTSRKEKSPPNYGINGASEKSSADSFDNMPKKRSSVRSLDSVNNIQSPKSEDSPYERNARLDQFQSPRSYDNSETADDIWLTVSEIPLFTQPTSVPPPSRPPPSLVNKSANIGRADVGRKKNESYMYTQDSARKQGASPIDDLEDFAMGRSQSNENADVLSEDSFKTNSAAEASAAAMKEAMDRAEAKFKHAKEVRERERDARYSKGDDGTPMSNRDDNEEGERQEQLEREKLQRELEERKRVEKERQLERERNRQAVERATREARQRAAAEAIAKQERAAVDKANAEARLRAERSAVQRAANEARERATAEARERAVAEAKERAAAEATERAAAAEAREKAAREKAASEARDRDRAAVNRAAAEARARAGRAAVDRVHAEARERAAAEARGKAAASSSVNREKLNKTENDLESFFGMGSRANSTPKQRATASDNFFETQTQGAGSADMSRRASSTSSSTIRKASSTTNIVDDLTSIFGGASSSGDFHEVDGETEERRRARLERHQRTTERAAKALAEKNERDMQAQREQAERNRFAETLDTEIKRWAAGKEGNLRALLSTLQYVLWPECGWQPVSLTDLITGAHVKKVYRKATLCIHPDKVQQKGATLQQKYIAEKVFDLLKEAWNKFNSEELF